MFENNPEIRETSPFSVKKILQQQLKTFCIQKDEDAHAQEAIGRKGSQILWKLYLQQWSLPRKNKISLHLFLPRMRFSQCARHRRRKKRWCYLFTEESPSANTRTRPRVSAVLCVQFGKWTRKEKVVCHVPGLNLLLQNTFPVMLSKSLKSLLPRWLLIANPPMSLSFPLSEWTQVEVVVLNTYIKCHKRGRFWKYICRYFKYGTWS